MQTRYWSCSKFADWLRGTAKPQVATGDDWITWRRTAKQQYPFRYWLAEEGLDYVQDFVTWPVRKLYDIKYYINNRWVTRTHQLPAHHRDIRPGTWCDVGNRFLPCLFNELVDFVEVELAWWHIAWAGREDRAKYGAPFWATGWFRWRTWRSAQAGLDNLAWQMTLTNADFLAENQKHLAEPTLQAINAKEILELYRWWTEQRPLRVDPMEASGWSDYCDRKREKHQEDWLFAGLGDDSEDTTHMHNKMHELEKQYEDEDEAMMIRLIKIRQSLWT